MLDDPQESRAAYRPSGKLDWLTFLPGLAATAGLILGSMLPTLVNRMTAKPPHQVPD
jgi:hypothetical protein